MRIVQINKYSTINGGSEVVADIVARSADAAGHSVLTIGFEKPGQTAIHGSISLGPERLAAKGMFTNRPLVEQARRIVEEFRPDAILHHNIYHHFPMAQLVEELDRRTRLPQSIILHDHKPVCPTYTGLRAMGPCRECSGGAYWKAIRHRCKESSVAKSALLAADSYWNASIRSVYSRFKRIISPSRFLATNVETMGIGRQIDVLVNPCPPVHSTEGPRDGIAFASRLIEEKGVDVLLHMARSLPTTRFEIAGDGPLLGELRSATSSMPNVTLLGRIGREEVGSLLSRVKYLLLPSKGLENNPMVGLEALARGTPILGAERGGIPELVEAGKGFLFDPSDLASATKIVEASIELQQEKWEKLSDSCMKWARQNSERNYFEALASLIA